MGRAALFLATGCYLGLIPGAPGTYASLATSLVYFGIFAAAGSIRPELHLATLALVTLLGTVAAAEVARERGLEDPQVVVIDEVAGQLVALLFLPVTGLNLLAATLLFRIFDVWKPYPIARLERLPQGVGIMADDLLAGVYANLLLRLVNRLLGG